MCIPVSGHLSFAVILQRIRCTSKAFDIQPQLTIKWLIFSLSPCDIQQLSSIQVYVEQNPSLTVTPLGGHSACSICWHAQSMPRTFAIFGRAPLFYSRSKFFHPYWPSIQVQRLKITEYHFEVDVKDTANPIRKGRVNFFLLQCANGFPAQNRIRMTVVSNTRKITGHTGTFGI